MTDELDNKEKIEYVWKNVPKPRDQWEDRCGEKCEAALAVACHSISSTLGSSTLSEVEAKPVA